MTGAGQTKNRDALAKEKSVYMSEPNTTSQYDATTLAAAQESLATIQSQLPVRPALTSKQRQGLATVGDKTLSFVNQSMETIRANPGVLPRAISVEEVLAKAYTHDNLVKAEASAGQCREAIRDTRIQIGYELYNVALMVYSLTDRPLLGNNLKERRSNLKRRFANNGKRSTSGGGEPPATV